jgi:hypothetical protein
MDYGAESFYKLVRRGDPETSYEAAATVDTTRLEKMVHNAIAAFPYGCIADDVLAQFPNHPYSSITARFSALERKKLITCGPDKRKGASGRNQRVMRINISDEE